MGNGKVVLLTLHGMGRTEEGYYKPLENNLMARLGGAWDDVVLAPVQYQQPLQKQEDEVWKRMTHPSDGEYRPLDWHCAREFLLFHFADAAALEHSGHRRRELYKHVQERIRESLNGALAAVPEETPVVAVAYSLGAQVLSNYLWDMDPPAGSGQQPLPPPTDPRERFLRLRTLTRLITIGCNIPIFVAGLPEIRCFNKPHPDFRWDNLYDRDDPLGWPLRALDGDYKEMVADVELNVGGWIVGSTPWSHTKYWESPEVAERVAERIAEVME